MTTLSPVKRRLALYLLLHFFGKGGLEIRADRFIEIIGILLFARFVIGEARSRRNQASDNHVLLQPAQEIPLAGNRRFGDYPRRFLE